MHTLMIYRIYFGAKKTSFGTEGAHSGRHCVRVTLMTLRIRVSGSEIINECDCARVYCLARRSRAAGSYVHRTPLLAWRCHTYCSRSSFFCTTLREVAAKSSGGNSSAQWVNLNGQMVLHETVNIGSSAGFEIYVETGGQLPSQASGTFSQCDVRFNAVDASGVAIGEQTLRFRYVVYYSDGSVSSDYAHRVSGTYIVPAHAPKNWWAAVKNIVVIAVPQSGAAVAKQGSVVAQSGAVAPVSYYVPPTEGLPLLEPLRPQDPGAPPLVDLIPPDLRVISWLWYVHSATISTSSISPISSIPSISPE